MKRGDFVSNLIFTTSLIFYLLLVSLVCDANLSINQMQLNMSNELTQINNDLRSIREYLIVRDKITKRRILK